MSKKIVSDMKVYYENDDKNNKINGICLGREMHKYGNIAGMSDFQEFIGVKKDDVRSFEDIKVNGGKIDLPTDYRMKNDIKEENIIYIEQKKEKWSRDMDPVILAVTKNTERWRFGFEETLEAKKFKLKEIYNREKIFGINLKRDTLPKRFDAGWSKDGFVIIAWDKKVKSYLKELYKAIMHATDDVWFFMRRDNLSRPVEPVIFLNKIPKNEYNDIDNFNKNSFFEEEYLNEVGIVEKMKEKNEIRYLKSKFCLLKINNDSMNRMSTNFPYLCFIFPFDVEGDKEGYYTVEEVKNWMDGYGPIIKENNFQRSYRKEEEYIENIKSKKRNEDINNIYEMINEACINVERCENKIRWMR